MDYSKHRHIPPSTRARCPVCREPVYSAAGIHPQCAVKLNEPPRPKPEPPVPAPEAAAPVEAGRPTRAGK